jgi:uncharacterized damage-inducible protein DinB
MPDVQYRLMKTLPEFDSAEVSVWFGHLEDQTRRLWEGLQGADAEELEWQPAPGMNTIGMLLAHLAVVEVFWITVLMEKAFLSEQVIGIGGDDDGMPIEEGAGPPPNLAGKALPYYNDMLMMAREHTRTSITGLEDADLTREIEHRRRDRNTILNGRWILYHVAEHLSGHFGQILLLRHLYRLR